jgi:hypothetical protein
MNLKPGVRLTGADGALAIALQVADSVYRSFNLDMTVTSVTDGRHKTGSFHYRGLAADVRTRNIAEKDRPALLTALRAALADWDVVDEGDHFHIEPSPAYGMG